MQLDNFSTTLQNNSKRPLNNSPLSTTIQLWYIHWLIERTHCRTPSTYQLLLPCYTQRLPACKNPLITYIYTQIFCNESIGMSAIDMIWLQKMCIQRSYLQSYMSLQSYFAIDMIALCIQVCSQWICLEAKDTLARWSCRCLRRGWHWWFLGQWWAMGKDQNFCIQSSANRRDCASMKAVRAMTLGRLQVYGRKCAARASESSLTVLWPFHHLCFRL